MKHKKGVSLITLVVTIVVIIILAAIVALNVSKTNPIKKANDAKIVQDYSTFCSDLELTIARMLQENPTLNIKDIDSGYESPFLMLELVPSMQGEKLDGVDYKDLYKVEDGRLVLAQNSDIDENPDLPDDNDKIKVKTEVVKIKDLIPNEPKWDPTLDTDEDGIVIPNIPTIKLSVANTNYTAGPIQATIDTSLVNERYKLCYREGETGEYIIAEENKIKVNVYNNKTIYAKIVRVNENGEIIEDVEERSISKDITMIDNLAPTEVTISAENVVKDAFILKATAKDATETMQSAKSGIAKYEFYINGSLYKTVDVDDSEEATCIVMDRNPLTNYSYYVVAKDRAGNEKASTTLNVTTTDSGYMVLYLAPDATNTPSMQTKLDGQPLTLATTRPRKNGYRFLNWSGNDGNTYTAGATYTTDKSIVLTGEFEVNLDGIPEYTLTIKHYLENADNDNYTYLDTTIETMYEYDIVKLEDCAKAVEHATFKYGSLTESEQGGDGVSQITIEDDTTVAIYYSRDVHTLTIKHYLEYADNTNFALSTTTTANLKYGANVVLKNYATSITNGTYSYASASASTLGGEAITTYTLENDSTVAIYYARNRYTLTLSAGSYISSVSPSGSTQYKVGQTVSISCVRNTNTTQYTYSFNRWTSSNTSLIANLTTQNTSIIMPAGNVTLTASATRTGQVYTITLNNQSASTAGTTALYEKYGTGIYLNSSCTTQITTSANKITVPKKTGYIFCGYYTSTNGGGTQLVNASGYITSSFPTTYTSNVTLYAYWTSATITFKKSGVTSSSYAIYYYYSYPSDVWSGYSEAVSTTPVPAGTTITWTGNISQSSGHAGTNIKLYTSTSASGPWTAVGSYPWSQQTYRTSDSLTTSYTTTSTVYLRLYSESYCGLVQTISANATINSIKDSSGSSYTIKYSY